MFCVSQQHATGRSRLLWILPWYEMMEASVRDLSEQLRYQPDAIVSQAILKSDGGNITLFAFAAGQELSEHTSPYQAMVYLLDGTAEVRIARKSHTVTGGEFIVLPAHIPHALKAKGNFKMLLCMTR